MSAWATDNNKPTFIQWRNTDLCMDFQCPDCGQHGHYEGLFMHFIRCAGCQSVFELSTGVEVRKVGAGADTGSPPKDPEPGGLT